MSTKGSTRRHHYSHVTFENDDTVRFIPVGGQNVGTRTLPRKPASRTPESQFNSLRRPAPIGGSVRGMTEMYEALKLQVIYERLFLVWCFWDQEVGVVGFW